MSLLIAPTLLDSYDWLMKCPPSWREKALNDITGTLSRQPWKPTPAMEAGTAFEQHVYEDVFKDLSTLTYSDNYMKVLRRLQGFFFQQKVSFTIIVDKIEYYIGGVIDCLKKTEPKEIVDIKTTANFKGDSQYLTKWQHRVYPLATLIPDFTYLICEWLDEECNKLKDVHEVHFHVDSFDTVRDELSTQIRKFISFIESDKTLCDFYYTTYNKYNKSKKV